MLLFLLLALLATYKYVTSWKLDTRYSWLGAVGVAVFLMVFFVPLSVTLAVLIALGVLIYFAERKTALKFPKGQGMGPFIRYFHDRGFYYDHTSR